MVTRLPASWLPERKAGVRRKYLNKPVTVDGLRFDSIREYRRWHDLRIMEQIGEITNLTRQVHYPLLVAGQKVAAVIWDFRYERAGQTVIEDVKSPVTRRNRDYRTKRKLFEVCYAPLRVTEVL
jgi:hypothetical protein